MSMWTYVRGAVFVHVVGVTQEQKDYIIKTVLNHLPVVSGSESDMTWTVSQVERQYEYISTVVDDRGLECRKADNESKYVITVHGNLRDRDYDTTKREFIKWLMRLARRFPLGIDEALFVISDKSWAFGECKDHVFHLTFGDFRKCLCDDDFENNVVFDECSLSLDKIRENRGAFFTMLKP